MHVVTKWQKWYDNQNDATKAYFEAQAKEDNKLIVAVAIPTFLLGLIFGFIFGLGV